MTDAPSRRWRYALAGALTVIVLLGYTGNLSSITPVDRLLNPNARNYWESESHYARSIFRDCSKQSDAALGPTGSGDAGSAFGAFKRCYDARLDDAIDRGWITAKGLREARGFAP